MNFKKAIFILIFFNSVICVAQSSLPFYEKKSTGEYYLLRNDSIHDYSQFNSVSIITKNGIEGKGKFINLHVRSEKECCTHPDPKFLMGTLQLNSVTDSVYYVLGGEVKEGKLFDTKHEAIPDVNKFMRKDFEKSIIDINSDSEYSYRWTLQSNGKYYFEGKKDSTNIENPSEDVTYIVDLNNCNYMGNDSIEILYCLQDSANENYYYAPRVSLIYLYGKLLSVLADFSATGAEGDGYGPFYYSLKFPVGWYKTENDFYILFSPGFVLHEHNGSWKEEAREPCLYYGECDCGE